MPARVPRTGPAGERIELPFASISDAYRYPRLRQVSGTRSGGGRRVLQSRGPSSRPVRPELLYPDRRNRAVALRSVPQGQTRSHLVWGCAIVMLVDLFESELLGGESVLLTKRANAIVRPTEYGLGRFPFDKYMGLVGMKGREALGGKLYLTSYRLVFKSHQLNRLTGSLSVLLPSICGIRDASTAITRKVSIQTASQDYEFVIWGISGFLAALEAQRAALDEGGKLRLLAAIAERPSALGSDLEIARTVDLLIKGSEQALDLLDKVCRHAEAGHNLINLVDALHA
jgi:hypothetical protein